MTRRPASRRPARLDDGDVPRAAEGPPRPARIPTARQRIVRSHVAGRHVRFGTSEVVWTARRVAAGEDRALLGLAPFPGADLNEVLDATRAAWDVRADAPVPSIDPDLTLAGMDLAVERVVDVASRGGRIALATGRPASMLPLLQTLARSARSLGGDLLRAASPASSPGSRRSSRHLWWIGGVAVVTDGVSLLADDGMEAGRALLFDLPRPDLVIADVGFAGHALADDIETVALVDLDALALALAAARGLPVTLVPLDTGRPAPAYEPLEEAVLDQARRAPADTPRA